MRRGSAHSCFTTNSEMAKAVWDNAVSSAESEKVPDYTHWSISWTLNCICLLKEKQLCALWGLLTEISTQAVKQWRKLKVLGQVFLKSSKVENFYTIGNNLLQVPSSPQAEKLFQIVTTERADKVPVQKRRKTGTITYTGQRERWKFCSSSSTPGSTVSSHTCIDPPQEHKDLECTLFKTHFPNCINGPQFPRIWIVNVVFEMLLVKKAFHCWIKVYSFPPFSISDKVLILRTMKIFKL